MLAFDRKSKKKKTHQMLSKKWPLQIILCISSLHIYYYCIIIHYMSKARRMYLGIWLQAHTLYFLILCRKHSLLTLSAVSSEGWALQPLLFCCLCYTIITKSIPLLRMGTNIGGTYVQTHAHINHHVTSINECLYITHTVCAHVHMQFQGNSLGSKNGFLKWRLVWVL